MASYKYASVVRLTMDDPRNDNLEEGDVLMTAGKCEDGVSHTVLNPETKGFTEVECEVIETFEADQVMSKSDIMDWGATQAKKANVMEKLEA
jgi:hypothetical protein